MGHFYLPLGASTSLEALFRSPLFLWPTNETLSFLVDPIRLDVLLCLLYFLLAANHKESQPHPRWPGRGSATICEKRIPGYQRPSVS